MAGFPTVILVLLVMGTFILLGLGVIGEYLARIHEEVRGRPRYLVQERSGLRRRAAPAASADAGRAEIGARSSGRRRARPTVPSYEPAGWPGTAWPARAAR